MPVFGRQINRRVSVYLHQVCITEHTVQMIYALLLVQILWNILSGLKAHNSYIGVELFAGRSRHGFHGAADHMIPPVSFILCVLKRSFPA